MYAPIVMFVYNRPDHFRKTYEALCKCKESKASELFIFSDGSKNESSKKGVEEVRKALNEIQNDDTFSKITCIESEINKGLFKSIVDGVTAIIEKFGRVIVLEDDCMPSSYFLNYMNNALDYYENDKDIGSIAGYAEPLTFPSDYTADIYLARRSCSVGWATWADRWKGIDWGLRNINQLLSNPKSLRMFNSNGSDRLTRLYRQSKGKAGSWSVCFGAHHITNNYLVVYPKYSYIRNIGDDGTGVHTKVGDIKIQTDLSLAIPSPDLSKPKLDNRIQHLLKKQYSAGTVSDMKRALAAVVICIKANLNRKGE